jgi:UDP-glucose 4-epimerase
MATLVLGGAGYIGSVTVERLNEAGRKVVVYDNLSRGHRDAVEEGIPFVQGDIANTELLAQTIDNFGIDSVMHFCAFIEVGESVKDPLKYYHNNLLNGLKLLEVLVEKGVDKFIFSSTAAVYGMPNVDAIDEDQPLAPINPYGWTKRMFEQILQDTSAAHDFRAIALRYFNACGATENHGEDHHPESHLIPIVLEVAQGKREALSIFGGDYDTPDGTCVRDYIHVRDLADAHIKALDALEKGAETTAYNLGNGQGFSVKQVVTAAEEVTARHINCIDAPRREGDPPRLVASSERIQKELQWRPQITNLRTIIESAWNWRQAHPKGYDDRQIEE